MRPVLRARLLLQLLSCATLPACVGTTGGDEFSFEAFAAGPPGANGSSYSFESLGYSVTLERARIHVGAVYLNRAVPTSGAGLSTTCTLDGIYSAEVPAELEVDALSPEPRAFPAPGRATSDPSLTGEVWLNHGDLDDPRSSTVILDVAGSASKDGTVYPFRGKLTIGENRLQPAPPATPGAHPICKERVVTPIAVDVLPAREGHLLLRIDPARMFKNVDFSELTLVEDGVFVFDDEPETADHPVDHASQSLYHGLRSTDVYEFTWE
ncbi:MAG TPA: hypothetical protein VGK73_07070 [Polyangiaceae bacterium]